MFHAPIVSTMIVSSGVQSLIHWILGVWWRRLRGKLALFPLACYACLVLSELIVKSGGLICFNIKEVEEKEQPQWKTARNWCWGFFVSYPRIPFPGSWLVNIQYCTVGIMHAVISFNLTDLVWFWLMFTHREAAERIMQTSLERRLITDRRRLNTRMPCSLQGQRFYFLNIISK